jgi:hypothetical protein
MYTKGFIKGMKDVEPAFDMLQAQFAIVRYRPPLSWFHDEM